MRSPVARSLLAVVVAAGAALAMKSAVAEGPAGVRARIDSMPSPPAAKTFIASHVAKGFTSPKTPWGDPDISGVFDTSPEANTPMERPAEREGRKMDEITPAELRDAIARRQQEAV